jgi:hypothetical protein
MKYSLLLLVLNALLLAKCNGDVGSLRKLQTFGNVVRFELINGKTSKKIRDIYNGLIIDISTIAGMSEPAFNVKAILSSGAALVVFDYQTTMNYRFDYSNPYTLCSDGACSVLSYGKHTIRANTYNSTSFNGAGVRRSISFEIRRTNVKPITSLQLISTTAVPSKVVMELSFNTINIVDLYKLGLSKAEFNIVAIGSNMVQSVKFSNGPTENSKPYTYCGNSGDTFSACNDLGVGADRNITVIGYSSGSQSGTAYPLQWARIQIVNSEPSLAAPVAPPMKAPVATPTKMPVITPVIAPVVTPAKVPNAAPVAATAPTSTNTPPIATRTCSIPEVSGPRTVVVDNFGISITISDTNSLFFTL